MQVQQIYSLVNTITGEILGSDTVVNEDLSNIVDIGTAVFGANQIDNYVKSLVNHIGRVIFVNRAYSGGAPSVLMDNWEFGSVLEKISAELPDATENDSWNLVHGQDYSPNVFHKPNVTAKFFNSKVTFEIDMSFTERQVKESFNSPAQLNGFISMIHGAIDKSLTVKIDSLIMRTINNMIAETFHAEYGTNSHAASSKMKAVNLLYEYKQLTGENTLTPTLALTDKEFIRYCVKRLNLYSDRLKKISTLFNIGEQARFTPADMLHVVLLSDFKAAANVYLTADTQNEKFVMLPAAETVPYWQGSGTDYSFDSISSINVKTASGNTVTAGGIVGIMFDRDSLGVSNLDRRVTTSYNPKAEFYNHFFKFDAGYFNDFNENFVVFFLA